MAARVLVALCLIGAVLIGASHPASACTCANRPVEERLAAADGAFIGTLVGIPASSVGPLEDGRPSEIPQSVPFVFDAEQWVKGERAPDLIDVHGPIFECGIEVPVGTPTAVFITVANGQAEASLCSFIDDTLVAAFMEPPRTSDAPAKYLAVPAWPEQAVMLAADGAVVATRPEDTYGRRQAECAAGEVVEDRNREVVRVDLSSFEDIEVLQFRRGASRLLCNEQWVLAVSERDGPQVYDVRTRRAVAAVTSAESPISLVGDRLIVLGAADDAGPIGWRAIDLTTGETTLLRAFDREVRDGLVSLSPTGEDIVFASTSGNQIELGAVNLTDGSERTVPLANPSYVQWIDNERILVTDATTGDWTIRDGTTLAVLTIFDTPSPGRALLTDHDTLVYARQGTIESIPVSGGSPTVLNQLPYAVTLVKLDHPVESARPPETTSPITWPLPSGVVEGIASSSHTSEELLDPRTFLPVGASGDRSVESGSPSAPAAGNTAADDGPTDQATPASDDSNATADTTWRTDGRFITPTVLSIIALAITAWFAWRRDRRATQDSARADVLAKIATDQDERAQQQEQRAQAQHQPR